MDNYVIENEGETPDKTDIRGSIREKKLIYDSSMADTQHKNEIKSMVIMNPSFSNDATTYTKNYRKTQKTIN